MFSSVQCLRGFAACIHEADMSWFCFLVGNDTYVLVKMSQMTRRMPQLTIRTHFHGTLFSSIDHINPSPDRNTDILSSFIHMNDDWLWDVELEDFLLDALDILCKKPNMIITRLVREENPVFGEVSHPDHFLWTGRQYAVEAIQKERGTSPGRVVAGFPYILDAVPRPLVLQVSSGRGKYAPSIMIVTWMLATVTATATATADILGIKC